MKIKKTAGLILFAILLFSPLSTSITDRMVLPEKKTPGYAEFLRMPYDYDGTVLREMAKRVKSNNLLINQIGFAEGEGYTLTGNEDGSITFSGINQSDQTAYYRIDSIDPMDLPDDVYTLKCNDLEAGLSVYLEGMVFDIGGGFHYELLSDLSQDNFRTNRARYSQYNCVLSIAPGFRSEEAVIMPMLCRANAVTSEYEPCIVENSSIEGKSYNYAGVQMLKRELTKLTAKDWNALLIDLKYSKDKWFFIAFEDRTGIQFIGDRAVYGRINHVGQVIKKEFNTEKSDIEDMALRIAEEESETDYSSYQYETIDDFGTYLKKICASDDIVFISVSDEGSAAIDQRYQKLLCDLGLSSSFSELFRHSYIALIENCEVKTEKSGTSGLTEDGQIAGVHYLIESNGFYSDPDKNCASSIILNGTEYSMNRRGMNIVILDSNTGTVKDTVCFDTCKGLQCFRPPCE